MPRKAKPLPQRCVARRGGSRRPRLYCLLVRPQDCRCGAQSALPDFGGRRKNVAVRPFRLRAEGGSFWTEEHTELLRLYFAEPAFPPPNAGSKTGRHAGSEDSRNE